MKKILGGLVKVPSTRGGKIRLLGLLAYSVASVVHPPLAAIIGGAVKALLTVASGQ